MPTHIPIRLLIANDSGLTGGGAENRLRYMVSLLLQQPDIAHISLLCSTPQNLPAEIEKNPKFKIHLMPSSWKNNIFAYRQLLIDERITLVQGHNLSTLSPLIYIWAKRHNCRTIWFAHDFWPLCIYKSFVNIKNDSNHLCAGFHKKNCIPCGGASAYVHLALYRRMMKHIDIAIAPGQRIQAHFEEHHFLQQRWQPLTPWIDLPETIPAIQSKKPFLLFVGSLKGYKGIWTLLYAFKALKTLHPELTLKIVSPDSADSIPTLLPFIHEHNLNTTLSFEPKQSLQALRQLYAKARILIFPSICIETFGLVWAEAMAMGCPIVASDIGGISEYAEPHARLFLPNNVDDLVRTTLAELHTPRSDAELVAAQHYVYQQFSPTFAIDKLMKIYYSKLSVQ